VDFYSKAPQPHRWIGWTVSFAMAADYIMTPHYTLLHIHCSKSSSIGQEKKLLLFVLTGHHLFAKALLEQDGT